VQLAARRSFSGSVEPENHSKNPRFAMKFLSLIGALAIIIAVAAAVFFFGGFYNVAATEPDPGIVAWALEYVRDASINRHAVDQPPVSMEDPATIQAGARAFASRGCTNCHGGPGVMWAKFSEGLRPDPPDLKEETKDLTPAQVFWIVRNGINMTGMPGFGLSDPPVPDQEIWTIAAFVKNLSSVSEDDYKAWTADTAPPAGEAAPPK
jgi:mono/diheme cytochrome c family protein